MGSKRQSRSQKRSPLLIQVGVFEIDSGIAEIIRDPYTPDAWLLRLNGAESSQLIPEYPERLGFEYMRWMAAVISCRYPTDTELRVLHLGGAGCTMARWAAHVYPNSTQTAVELDAKLAQLARDNFGLPRAPRLKIRVGEAGQVLASSAPSSRDVIIRDVFAQADAPGPGEVGTGEHIIPEHLTGLEAARTAADVLAPDGLYLLNYGGPPGLDRARAEAATLREVFERVALISDPAMFKSRRRGNIVLVGTNGPLAAASLGGLEELRRQLLADAMPAHIRTTLDPGRGRGMKGSAQNPVDEFIAGTAPNNFPLLPADS